MSDANYRLGYRTASVTSAAQTHNITDAVSIIKEHSDKLPTELWYKLILDSITTLYRAEGNYDETVTLLSRKRGDSRFCKKLLGSCS